MTAEELTEQRFQRERNELSNTLRNEWNASVKTLPAGDGPNAQEARNRMLSTLRARQADEANTFLAGYNKIRGKFKEVESLGKSAGWDQTRIDEVKMRSILAADMEAQVFPKVKEDKVADPQKEFDAAYLHGQKIEAGLEKFLVREKRSVVGGWSARNKPWLIGGGRGSVEVPAGGVDVITEPSRMVGGTRTTPKSRAATQDEIGEWASLTAEQQRVAREKSSLLKDLRTSDPEAARLRTAAYESSRMGNMGPLTREEAGGTFAQKVAAIPTPKAIPQAKRMVADNPQTGGTIVSDDGGKTWQPMR